MVPIIDYDVAIADTKLYGIFGIKICTDLAKIEALRETKEFYDYICS